MAWLVVRPPLAAGTMFDMVGLLSGLARVEFGGSSGRKSRLRDDWMLDGRRHRHLGLCAGRPNDAGACDRLEGGPDEGGKRGESIYVLGDGDPEDVQLVIGWRRCRRRSACWDGQATCTAEAALAPVAGVASATIRVVGHGSSESIEPGTS